MISKLIKQEKPKMLDNINYFGISFGIDCVDISEIIEEERKKDRKRSHGHRSKKCYLKRKM